MGFSCCCRPLARCRAGWLTTWLERDDDDEDDGEDDDGGDDGGGDD